MSPPTHVLQMSDRGMGVPLRKIERLFSYMYSTAPTPPLGTGGAPLVGAMGTLREGGQGWGCCGDTLGVVWGHLEVARVARGCFEGGMASFGGAWGSVERVGLGMGTSGDI